MNGWPPVNALALLAPRGSAGAMALAGPIVLGWAALASLGIVAVYGLNAPRLLLKSPTGRLRIWSWVAFWPYHLLCRLSLGLYRLAAREAPFHEIRPGLFLGSCLRRSRALELCAGGPVSVLDLTSEFSECEALRHPGHYCWLPVLDHRAPSLEQLRHAVAFINAQLPAHRVYVHCAVGHGRSATCVAAFLLATRSVANPDDAIAMLKSRRPGIRVNRAQMEVLHRFHDSLTHDHERGNL